MSKLSKLILFIFVFLIITPIFLSYKISQSHAVDAVPELLLSCTETRSNEFNSLRPYQAAPCGEPPVARFCSNRLVIFEDFELSSHCNKTNCTNCDIKFTCEPEGTDPSGDKGFYVAPHDLNITLDESEFPILGNTEDPLSDSTKVNEYASWYLSGLNANAEIGVPTENQIINYSGPLKKLLPGAIADDQRIKTIKSIETTKSFTDEDTGKLITDSENHDQYVVCGEKQIQLIPSWLTNMFGVGAVGLGRTVPTPCYDNSKYRLSYWDESLVSRLYQEIQQWLIDHPFYPPTFVNKLIASATLEHWSKKTPPLPWDDGTGKPFKSSNAYIKAYKEWQGDLCILIPLPAMFDTQILGGNEFPLCVGIPGVTNNEYADLFPYIPLSNNSDQRGKNYLLTGDGPNYVASSGTVIANAKHVSYLNAPLYFPHTKEVYDLSTLLNKTFIPKDTCFSDCMAVVGNTAGECNTSCGKSANSDPRDFPDDVEKLKKGAGTTPYIYDPANPSTDPYDYLDCTAVNVRTNEGDNLFPGDRPGKPNDKELYVRGAEYLIKEVECHEKNERVWDETGCTRYLTNGTKEKYPCWVTKKEFRCQAEVGIEFKLGTQTPWANEIFKNTVAGTDSTFRKIFPKVSENAPVNCIADIPTTTGVEYSIENDLNEKPNGGSQRLGKESIPADGAPGMELTFSHIGSVYEYFLHGIQTALRPKGYGYPIANGNCTPASTGTGSCKQWLFEKDKSGAFYYDKIISAASQAKCNGKSLNPFWAIGIALNENGGLMSDDLTGLSSSHFGCNVKMVQTIEDKIKCMINTLRNDCLAGKTDQATLYEYGYLPGYVLWPITVLSPGGAYPPPIFGSGFNTTQLKANLLSTDWRAAYASVAHIFCPNSPTLPN